MTESTPTNTLRNLAALALGAVALVVITAIVTSCLLIGGLTVLGGILDDQFSDVEHQRTH